jgi:hypothetical protein
MPATLQTTPGGHGSQSDSSVNPLFVDHVPVGQKMQLTLSSRDLYVPAAQGPGDTVPSSGQECPEGQSMHCTVAMVAVNVPGVQGTSITLPGRDT